MSSPAPCSDDLESLTLFCDFMAQTSLQSGTVITLLLGSTGEVNVNVDHVSTLSGGDMTQVRSRWAEGRMEARVCRRRICLLAAAPEQ